MVKPTKRKLNKPKNGDWECPYCRKVLNFGGHECLESKGKFLVCTAPYGTLVEFEEERKCTRLQ